MKRNLALTLLLSFALFAKALIPSGWMPSGARAFEITVCAGAETHSLWLDKNGKLREQNPDGQKGGKDGACPFTAMAFAADLPAAPPIVGEFVAAPARDVALPSDVATGKGLAAPPPPQTGPPTLI